MRIAAFFLVGVVVMALDFYVFVDALNVRECPSTGCSVVGVLKFMDTFEGIDVVYTDGYDWVRMESGFVALQYVDAVPLSPSSVTVCFDPNTSTNPIPPDYVPKGFVEIPTWMSIREGLKLRKDALEALKKMFESASKDGIRLRVVSAYRSWYYQRYLYLKALEEYGPDQRWVAKPGRSEHQLGVAIDLVGADISLALKPDFKKTREHAWLKENARRFGFIQSYPEGNPHYEEEPWHFRYSPCNLYPSGGR